MPELNLKESIITSLNAQEPWPDNVKLFQPYEVEQILLPDNASCLAVQAFLKMCNLPFEVEMRWNAEFMSPSGRVPFIKCGAFVVSELEPIVQFAANKGVSLCSRLSTEEKAEMRAYMSLITNVLVNAELYISWLDSDTYNAVTKVRNSSVYPWPLGWIQTRSKRNMVAKRLKALHWHDKTLDQVLADVEQCCNSLSQRLGDKEYFFGTPTPLDALACGHVRALLAAPGPRAARLARAATATALLAHALRVVRAAGMKLTPQEEYLVSKASLVACRRREPRRPDGRERRSRSRPSREHLPVGDEVFGFKPFASKQIALSVSKDGNLTCEYEGQRNILTPVMDDEDYVIINNTIDEVLEKVDEVVAELENADRDVSEDFVICNKPEMERNDYLDTIDENIENDSTVPDSEDVIKIIDSEDDEAVLVDSVQDDNPQKRESESKPGCLEIGSEEFTSSEMNRSSASEQESLRYSARDSRYTLKMPSNEEISIESLLEMLRKKNPEFHHCIDVAEVD